MPIRVLFCFFLLAVMALTPAARGQDFALPGTGVRSSGPTVTARAALSDQPLLPGKNAQIAVEIAIKSGYHVQSAFAPNPYIPTQLTVKPAPGLSFGTIQYQKGRDIPTPPALGSGTLSVYGGKAYILVPLSVAADATPGELPIELSLLTQACDDKTCDPPKTITLKLTAQIGQPGDAQTQPDSALFAAAREQQFGVPQTPSRPATAPSTSAPTQVPLLSTAQQLAAIAQRPYQPFNTDEQRHALPEIFLFALLGGLILNIMPCVLPVIPLKALSFIQQAHGDHRLAILHGLTFSAGIVSLFVALAVALRGLGLFYGQQFQSPAFLILMTLIVVALALSMLGVWTINPPQSVFNADARFSHRSGFLASYSSGLLATLLATPCSAPFLGPVFAWALVQPAWLTAAALAVVGLGMSLPYLFLALFPQLLNKVPRAGRWSELLKQGLGIVMLGVAIYLITRIPNTRLWFWILMAGLLVALVCWAWGQIPTLTMSPGKFWTIRVVVVVVGIAVGVPLYIFGDRAARPPRSDWQPFNVALLDQGLREGRPVVIDWTADWCINCQALDAAVLSRDETQRAFTENNVLLLRADLTTDNPEATALNRKLGGEAIPVLAIFAPSRPTQPVVLRDSYSTSRVIQEVQQAR